MRQVFEVTITGIVVIDNGQPDEPGLSTPDNWAVHEIVTEMQGTDVDVQEMQVIQKAPAMTIDSPSSVVDMSRTLKDQLPLWRYKACLNGSQLSRIVGKERTWCKQVESGRNKGNLDMDTCYKLAKALDLNESDLWNLITKKQGPAEIEIKTSLSVSQPNLDQINLYNAALADEAGES